MRVQSVERAVAILQAFTPETPLLGIGDISRQLALDRSAVQRMVASLVRGNLVEQDPVSGKYRLGLGVLEAAGTMLQGRNLPGAVHPYLRELTDLTGESVYLSVLYRGDSVLQIADAPSAHLIQYNSWTGHRMPLYCTASGRILMAKMAPGRLERLLQSLDLRPLTAKTIIDRAELSRRICEDRERGYSITLEEFREGINAVAAAIPVPEGEPLFDLAVAGPKYRFSEARIHECIDALWAVTNELSSRLSSVMFCHEDAKPTN